MVTAPDPRAWLAQVRAEAEAATTVPALVAALDAAHACPDPQGDICTECAPTDVRDGLARAIRDAYAADIIPADTLLSDEGWSGLVGSVEEWHPEADAALAYLAARPAVDVEASPAERHTEAVARVLSEHRRTTTTPLPGVTYYDCCSCGWVDLTGPDHARHQAEQIAALGVTR